MKASLLILLALLILVLAFFSYQGTQDGIFKNYKSVDVQTGYGISGAGATAGALGKNPSKTSCKKMGSNCRLYCIGGSCGCKCS